MVNRENFFLSSEWFFSFDLKRQGAEKYCTFYSAVLVFIALLMIAGTAYDILILQKEEDLISENRENNNGTVNMLRNFSIKFLNDEFFSSHKTYRRVEKKRGWREKTTGSLWKIIDVLFGTLEHETDIFHKTEQGFRGAYTWSQILRNGLDHHDPHGFLHEWLRR